MTYTIVAVDRQLGAVGVATASHSVNLLPKTIVAGTAGGRSVVVASQAFSNRALGEACLTDLLAGADASTAGASALAEDHGRGLRQLVMAESDGSVAAFTGERCVPWAGQLVDETVGLAMAGNMLRDGSVLVAARQAFALAAKVPFAERLLRSLAAASVAGGDFRGDRSAGIHVRAGHSVLDLRTDDHADPVVELERLLHLRLDTAVLADCYAWYAAGCDQVGGHALLGRIEACAAKQVDDDLTAWAEIVRELAHVPGGRRLGLSPAARRLVDALVADHQGLTNGDDR
jgi:uncharacterized Ntn-hydrolase superfamily protein